MGLPWQPICLPRDLKDFIPLCICLCSCSCVPMLPLKAPGEGAHAVRTEHKLASLSSIAFFRGRKSNKPHGKQRNNYSYWKHRPACSSSWYESRNEIVLFGFVCYSNFCCVQSVLFYCEFIGRHSLKMSIRLSTCFISETKMDFDWILFDESMLNSKVKSLRTTRQWHMKIHKHEKDCRRTKHVALKCILVRN